MIDSIFVALSGMLGHERGLNVISNNVANMNTAGFRGSSVSFTDVFIGTTPDGLQGGPAGERGIGGGLDAGRTQLDFRAGERQPTGIDLDLFLKGDGFFVLQDENGEIRYSRAGAFDFNEQGELVVRDSKLKVMSRNPAGQLVPLTLKDLEVNPAKRTSEVTFGDTLSPSDAEQTIESLAVFDQHGAQHTLRVVFSRDTTAPSPGLITWKVTVSEGGQEVGSGRLDFISSQAINSPLNLTLALRNTEPMEVAFNFTDVNGADLGQNAQSTISVRKQDGFASGTLATKTFDAAGVLKLTYSNGQTADGAKLALAQIGDLRGLVELGNAQFAYRGTRSVTISEAGDDLQVQNQALERSNVDLTAEFSELVLMQRGYQASSQVLSTANDMLQELFDLRGRR